jgi:hypothetical protein
MGSTSLEAGESAIDSSIGLFLPPEQNYPARTNGSEAKATGRQIYLEHASFADVPVE